MVSSCLNLNLGTTSYEDAMNIQNKLHALISCKKIPNILLTLEHPHTITIGKTGSNQDLKINAKSISESGVDIIKTNRGGKATYHGPGQLIAYPIINLRELKLGPQKYIFKIEETIIKTLNEFGVNACRSIGNPGVWVKNSKIAAVGVKISNGISSHGFSVNLNTDLSYFDFIIPCGIADKSICSLYSLGIKSIDENHFRKILIKNFSLVFNLSIQISSPYDIEHMHNINII